MPRMSLATPLSPVLSSLPGAATVLQLSLVVHVSTADAQTVPSEGEPTTSRKSNIPAHRPRQSPRWMGSPTALAMFATNSGLASSAFDDVTTHESQGRVLSSRSPTIVPGKVSATCPASPAVIVGKLTSLTFGGAIISGVDHVSPWSRDTDRYGRWWTSS